MYRHIIDRSDLEEVVCLVPKGHPDNPTGKFQSRTRRQELEKYPGFHMRRDIVLFNATRSGREYILEVTATGYVGDLVLLDFLTNEELLEVEGIAQRMRQNAIDFPPAAKLLAPDPEAHRRG